MKRIIQQACNALNDELKVFLAVEARDEKQELVALIILNLGRNGLVILLLKTYSKQLTAYFDWGLACIVKQEMMIGNAARIVATDCID